MQGVKLKGFFNLVQHMSSSGNELFLMKSGNVAEHPDFENNSAFSGRSMEEISALDWQWELAQDLAEKPPQQINATEKLSTAKAAFPGFIRPMLATLTDRPSSESNWLYELKLDGYRIIGAKNGRETELFSRNGNPSPGPIRP